jgi:hypothetical protein
MITDKNILEYILLDIDNELSIADKKMLMRYLANNTTAAALYNSYANTKLISFDAEVYPAKLNLLAIANNNAVIKNNKIVYYRIAAGLLLIVSIASMFLFLNKTKNIEPLVANENKDSSVKNIAQTKAVDTFKTITVKQNIIIKDETKNIITKRSIVKYKNTNKIIIAKKDIKKKLEKGILNTPKILQYANMEILEQIKPLALQNKKNFNYDIENKSTSFYNLINNTNQVNTTIANNNDAKSIEPAFGETRYMANSKFYQTLKKVSQAAATVYSNAKAVKQEGVEIDLMIPKFLLKKAH